VNIKRAIFVTGGLIAVVLGVIGIVLPVLPTTPFLLLASWCFARSSPRFHHWLIQHPKLGPLITMWQSGKGIPKKARNRAILAIAAGMTVSAIVVGKLWLVLMRAVIGLSVSLYLLRLPIAPEQSDENAS